MVKSIIWLLEASHMSPVHIAGLTLDYTGANIGGSDGIDISGDNHWVHDVEVTNRYLRLLSYGGISPFPSRDECVTIKSPASNMLIERSRFTESPSASLLLTLPSLVQSKRSVSPLNYDKHQMFMT